MKRRDFVRHYNPKDNVTSTVPRHSEVNEFLARKICRDLHIPAPD